MTLLLLRDSRPCWAGGLILSTAPRLHDCFVQSEPPRARLYNAQDEPREWITTELTPAFEPDENPWSPAPEQLSLQASVVHIWRMSLSLTNAQLHHLQRLLSSDERQRLVRLHFERDRRRYAAAHGALRCILARYVETAPAELSFGVGASGKPFLSIGDTRGVSFNLSHSADAGLVAVARDRDIGIDLEQTRTISRAAAIVESIFSLDDQRRFHAASEAERDDLFFRFWTRHESYLKATGQGLAGAEIGSPKPFLETDRQGERSAPWETLHFTPYPGYVGALTVGADALRHQFYDWVPPHPEGGEAE